MTVQGINLNSFVDLVHIRPLADHTNEVGDCDHVVAIQTSYDLGQLGGIDLQQSVGASSFQKESLETSEFNSARLQMLPEGPRSDPSLAGDSNRGQ